MKFDLEPQQLIPGSLYQYIVAHDDYSYKLLRAAAVEAIDLRGENVLAKTGMYIGETPTLETLGGPWEYQRPEHTFFDFELEKDVYVSKWSLFMELEDNDA